jgi:multidrug efflux pump subunit AcrA (membrane-fusion protein)
MLNISDHNKHIDTQLDRFKTVKGLEARPHYKILNRLITLVAILAFITLFALDPKHFGKGAVTTLKPNQRPQSIQSVISGRIEKWYVKEGDFV